MKNQYKRLLRYLLILPTLYTLFFLSLLISNILFPSVNPVIMLPGWPFTYAASESVRQVKYLTRSDILSLAPILRKTASSSPFETIQLTHLYLTQTNPHMGGFYSRVNGEVPNYSNLPNTDGLLNLTKSAWNSAITSNSDVKRFVAFSTAIVLLSNVQNMPTEAKQEQLSQVIKIFGSPDNVIKTLGGHAVPDYAGASMVAFAMILQADVSSDDVLCTHRRHIHEIQKKLADITSGNNFLTFARKNPQSFLRQMENTHSMIFKKCKGDD